MITGLKTDAALAPLSVAHILASIDDQSAGPSFSVPALAAATMKCGARTEIHTIAGWRAAPQRTETTVPVHRHRPSPGILGRTFAASPALLSVLRDLARTSDVIHSHGLWLAPNVYPAQMIRAPNARAKFVLSPRGMLAPAAWRFGALKKRLSWSLYQRQALQRAHLLHATADSEYEEIRAAGLTTPVAVIPNGVDKPDDRSETAPRDPVVLSIGRIHPKKGLDLLLQAWAAVEARHPTWRLHIAGPSEHGHAEELKALAARLRLSRASITEGLYAEAKARALTTAGVFVLPSLNENFAMSVAEALSHGLPVISTQGAPWRGLEVERCGWWVPTHHEGLAAALDTALSISAEDRDAMGRRGRAWMERDFSWDRVGQDMTDVYRWLARGGPPPSTVRLN